MEKHLRMHGVTSRESNAKGKVAALSPAAHTVREFCNYELLIINVVNSNN